MNPNKRRRLAEEADEAGLKHLEKAEYQAAANSFLQAAELWKRLKNEKLAYAMALGNAANSLGHLGKYSHAKLLLEKSLPLLKKEQGEKHLDVALSLNNLANIHYEQGNYNSAKALYKKSLPIIKNEQGTENPHVATVLNNIANIHYKQGDYNVAKVLYEKVLAIRDKSLGKEHPDIANVLNNLAVIYEKQDDYNKAKDLHEKALTIQEKKLEQEHPDIALTLNDIAYINHKQGNYDTARTLYERALAIQEKNLGWEHPSVIGNLNNLAIIHQDKGNYEQAQKYFERAQILVDKIFDKNHPTAKIIKGNYLELQQEVEILKKKNVEEQIKRKETEKLSYLGSMATGIAHNINNPINNISLSTQYGLRQLKKGNLENQEAQEIFNEIMLEVQRLASIVGRFRDFSKGDRSHQENVSLNDLAQRVAEYFDGQFQAHDVRLVLELDENAPQAFANQFVVEEVLINVLTNAREAIEKRPSATVWVKTSTNAEHSVIQIEDNGDGVPEDEQKDLFSPFHSKKVQGTGLGLHFAKSALERISGTIAYQSRSEGGACFTVNLLPPQGEIS